MEEKESFASGIAGNANEAPESHHVAPRSENCRQFGGPTATSPTPAPAPAPALAPAPVSVAATTPSREVVKKKRGRPRKYGPDGRVALPLSPMPISSSIPLTGEFSAWKRGRGRPLESLKKLFKHEFESLGPGTHIAF